MAARCGASESERLYAHFVLCLGHSPNVNGQFAERLAKGLIACARRNWARTLQSKRDQRFPQPSVETGSNNTATASRDSCWLLCSADCRPFDRPSARSASEKRAQQFERTYAQREKISWAFGTETFEKARDQSVAGPYGAEAAALAIRPRKRGYRKIDCATMSRRLRNGLREWQRAVI